MRPPNAYFIIALLTSTFASTTNSYSAITLVQFIFDDFRTPYSAPIEGTAGVQPGVIDVTATNPHQKVIDTLKTGNTTGAIRTTTVDIDPQFNLNNLAVFSASATDKLPPRLSLNADFLTGGTVLIEYDFCPVGESVNAAVDTTHVIIDLVSTDVRDTDMVLTFTDIHGNTVTKDAVTDLGAILTQPGPLAFPFEDFAPIDFSQLTGMQMFWRAGEGYDGEIAVLATGLSIDAVPEPGSSLLLLLGCSALALKRRRPNSN